LSRLISTICCFQTQIPFPAITVSHGFLSDKQMEAASINFFELAFQPDVDRKTVMEKLAQFNTLRLVESEKVLLNQ
jgi:hypothetical protein